MPTRAAKENSNLVSKIFPVPKEKKVSLKMMGENLKEELRNFMRYTPLSMLITIGSCVI
jgi:hypothetical protein